MQGVGLLVFGIVLAISLGILAVLLALRVRRPTRVALPFTTPPLPASKPPANCQLPAVTVPASATSFTMFPGFTGGVVTATDAHLRPGQVVGLSQSLTLIATGDILIEGSLLGRLPTPTQPSIDITIVSLNGTVKIARGARIGIDISLSGAGAAPGAVGATDAVAVSGPGTNGGTIRVIAVRIVVDGSIEGAEGGMAGIAVSHASGVTTGAFGITYHFGGGATSIGAGGGTGGDVILCARDAVNFGPAAVVTAGTGGEGGFATATSANGSLAFAQGGRGHDGGDVVITGTGRDEFGAIRPCAVLVEAGALVSGGAGGAAGTASAYGGSGEQVLVGRGGDAAASAGQAGTGGTVIFRNSLVTARGVVSAGDGGMRTTSAGNAEAEGGMGADGAVDGGYAGGDATATGGRGAPAGAAPSIPLASGLFAQGRAGRAGSGGDAKATPGTGGAANVFGGTGSPGTGMATGGLNAAGTGLAPTALSSDPSAPATATGQP